MSRYDLTDFEWRVIEPLPPSQALLPCVPTPVHRQADGSATSADAEGTIRDGRHDLAECEARRRALVDGWTRSW